MAAKCLPVMVLVGQLTSTYFSKIWFVKTFKNKIENWVLWTGLLLSLQIFILLTWLDIAESIFSLSLFFFIYYLDCYILISHGTILYQDLLSWYNFIYVIERSTSSTLGSESTGTNYQRKKIQILYFIISCQGKSLVSFGCFFFQEDAFL